MVLLGKYHIGVFQLRSTINRLRTFYHLLAMELRQCVPLPKITAMDQRLIEFERLLKIMDELRAKCPWDKEQTFDSHTRAVNNPNKFEKARVKAKLRLTTRIAGV